MKRRVMVAAACALVAAGLAWADDADGSADESIDALLSGDATGVTETPDGGGADAVEETPSAADALSDIAPVGFGLSADYNVIGSYLPGWGKDEPDKANYTPWGNKFHFKDLASGRQPFGGELNATIALHVYVSSVLSFHQSVRFSIQKLEDDDENLRLGMPEFYGKYNLLNHVYFQFGKYDYKWGLSPNYHYTDLLSRIPYAGYFSADADAYSRYSDPGDLYLLRADVPIGIGGFQVITTTREHYFTTDELQQQDLAIGGKFNLATRFADMNLGTLYFRDMPWRTYASVKATVFSRAEFYAESLFSIQKGDYRHLQNSDWHDPTFSGSLGFYYDFFDGALTINAEYYYNGETAENSNTYQYENQLEADDKKLFLFPTKNNVAFNVKWSAGPYALTFFARLLYAFNDRSGEFVPGVSIEPVKHVKFYAAMPLMFGSNPDGTYYRSNADKYNRPFSFILAISIHGNFRFVHYNDD